MKNNCKGAERTVFESKTAQRRRVTKPNKLKEDDNREGDLEKKKKRIN